MAKNKVMKKKSKKKVIKTKVKRVSKPVKRKVRRPVRSPSKKIKIASWNLITFVALSAIAVVLTNASSNQMFKDLLFLIALLLMFVALAFFIVLLVLVFLKIFRR